MKKNVLLFFLLILWCSSCREAPNFNTPNKNAKLTGTIASKAMVVSAHPRASEVGVRIMQEGGNAIDAAVATMFALAVNYPRAGNIGGGGFMVYRTGEGAVTTLDFREKAPAKAHRDLYLDSAKNVIPRLSIDGHLAVGVPGTVDGLVRMHERYGSMPFADLVAPAIKMAEASAFVSEDELNHYNEHQDEFVKFSTRPPPLYKKGGWSASDSIRQTDLAQTLRYIAERGRAGFYEGPVADSIVAEMERGDGIISHQDLKNYQSQWREPIRGQVRNFTIYSMGPPSSGGIALLQLLEMLEPYPINKWGGYHDFKTVHHIIEAERRVYADRATHLGDPDFYEVPIAGLLDSVYLRDRMKDFDEAQASRTKYIKAGNPKGAVSVSTNKGTVESEETTHLSIVDAAGNAVSITTTLNGNYGSKVFVGGAGFLLNNEMDDFSAKPGVPNMFGLVGNEANAIQPGKRMLSSMTPTIIEKDGLLFMVIGTPGGSTIITSVLQSFINVTAYDMSMQEAINAKRFHHQWKPDTVYMEKGAFDELTQEKLSKMGHHLVERGPIGRVDAILVRENGNLEGGADIRGDDAALGF